jgi:hypothetical protein
MNFCDVKADLASVQMKGKDFVWPSRSVCVSQDLRAVMIDAVRGFRRCSYGLRL